MTPYLIFVTVLTIAYIIYYGYHISKDLYGEKAFWVRPEKMFFEKVTRDEKTFNRFLEIEM
jgi:hypothetical protein